MERTCNYKGIRLQFETSLEPSNDQYFTVFSAAYRLYDDYGGLTDNPKNRHEHPKENIADFVYYPTAEDSEAGAIYYANNLIDDALF